MFDLLIKGRLAKDPQIRTGKTGRPFTTGALVARDGETSMLVSLIAFGSEGERLGTMSKGDALSVAGTAKPTEWDGSDGSMRRGMSVTVSKILTLDDAQRGEKRNNGSQPVDYPRSRSAAPQEQFIDDEIPF